MSRRPPSLRNAEYGPQHRARQLQSMSPGTLNGRLASASPFGLGSDAVAAFATESHGTDSVQFARDRFALASSTPALALSYVPVDSSLHVYLNGIEQDESVDYTLTGQTVAVLAAMDARTADVLDCRYAWVTDLSTVVTDIPPLNIPYGSGGWKWTDVDPGTGWEQPTFDDSAWAVGTMPIGNAAFSGVVTITSATKIWVRRLIGPGTGITIGYHESRFYSSFINGTAFQARSTGGFATSTDAAPDQTSIWLFASEVNDFGIGPSHDIGIDNEIIGVDA